MAGVSFDVSVNKATHGRSVALFDEKKRLFLHEVFLNLSLLRRCREK